MRPNIKGLIFICITLQLISAEDSCPAKCTCKKYVHYDEADMIKVRCGDEEKLQLLVDDDFLNIANDVVQLNLSGNALSVFAPNVSFPTLQKLDLSKNYLTTLTAKMFIDMADLKRLDLSQNKIAKIDINAFAGLKYLDRLKLNQNKLTTIEKGTFDTIKNLKQLDISSNPLNCDCSLLWLLDWSNKKVVKLLSNPKCGSPKEYATKPLRKIKVGDEVHCKSPAKTHHMPAVTLSPDHSQVVFERDTFKLQCRARSITERYDTENEPRDRIEWLWLDSNPRHHFPDIIIENRYFADDGVIDSTLQIQQLHRNHSGIWSCRLISLQQGNHSTGITLVVISEETKYCPITTTSNNKGTYTWPRTVINNTVTLQCMQTASDGSEQFASYFCSAKGQWERFNTSNCTFTSETTRILEQFAGANLFTLAKAQIIDSAKMFRNMSDIKILKNTMDLVYAGRTIENYLNFLMLAPDLGELLLEIVNSFMEFDEKFLLEAETTDGTCGKLVNSVEKITNSSNLLPQQLHKSHLITEKFSVRRDSFAGMTCTWYLDGFNVLTGKVDRIFHCATLNVTSPVAQNKEVEASVEVPSNLFYQLQENDIMITNGNLLVGMFDDGKFFPMKSGSNNRIVSIIIGIKLDNLLLNLTHPIYIMLKPIIEISKNDLSSPTPVWWNPILKVWTTEGCQLQHELQDRIVFSCSNLGYYGLLQDVTHVAHYSQSGAKFKLSHPAVYVGSIILFICLLFCVLTYIFSYSAIQMPKKAKHSLINTWISVMMLCFIYIFGIYQTEDLQLCQAIGLILHYLTLSSLLWMCVGVNTMYKRLRKNITDVIELQDDELPTGEEPIQKPILGLYLIGWGIALIVCGISGAVNMKEYSAHSHCFLSNGPALSALYIPFLILIAFLIVFFLLIKCAIYGNDTNGHLSEGTQATENVDLDLLEPNFPETTARSLSLSTKTTSSEIEDLEHAPMAQLKAYVIFLVLYILAWIVCALATTINKLPFSIPHEEDVFSIIYAVLAGLLGLFSLFFYCIARNDVRSEWVLLGRNCKGKGKLFRTRNVSDVLPPRIPEVTNTTGTVLSRSSSRSSANTKSINSNALKAAAIDLNTSAALTDNSATKINNVNLVVLHRHQYRHGLPNLIENPTHSAEMFYNPHQSTVARKFFKKQKRNMMKRNNLQARRPAASEASSIPSRKNNEDASCSILYANNAKVNNTNIHVERTPNKTRNLNILSDNSLFEEEQAHFSKSKRLPERRIKKRNNAYAALANINSKKSEPPCMNNITNVRSVSQQCTLEYSSEPISDSILDLKSPEEEKQEETVETSGVAPSSTRRENSPNTSTLTATERFYAALPLSSSTPSPATTARIYVNPAHDDYEEKRAQSRASSVSATEIDELYQQIKRGPRYINNLSDSEVKSYAKSTDKDETTV